MKKTILTLLVALMATTGATAQIAVSGSGNSRTFTMPAYDVEVTTELWYKLNAEKTLAENQSAYGTKRDFFLDRTLTKDKWNTFASPFAIASNKMEAYFGAGAKVRKLGSTGVSGNVLTLNFVAADEIVAGKPYIVKPTAANVVDPTFEGVDLTAASASPDNTTYVNFIPTLGKTTVTGDSKDILILNTAGNLVHPTATGEMKGFRGYFVMHEAAAGAREFVIDFGDGEISGIQLIENTNRTNDTNVYDLQGRKLDGKPTQKGVYIVNGKKVVIK